MLYRRFLSVFACFPALTALFPYVLFSVMVHKGLTIQSGHYYSYIRTADNAWYKMDDHNVSKVKLRVETGDRIELCTGILSRYFSEKDVHFFA